MIHYISFLILAVIQSSALFNLTVEFPNVPKNSGQVYVQLMNQDKEVLEQKIVAVKNHSAIIKITGLKPGKYAIRAFQDLNGNGKFDIGIFGPKEPYGFSNNVRGVVGEPDFNVQLFELKQDFRVSIQLK
jgi:uncharacterized protein (DUF2141 family)